MHRATTAPIFRFGGRRVGGNRGRGHWAAGAHLRTGTSGKGGIIINNNMVVAGGEPRWNAQLGVWEGNAAALGTKAHEEVEVDLADIQKLDDVGVVCAFF